MLNNFRSRLVLSNLLLTLIGLLVLGVVFTRVVAERNKDVKEQSLAADARFVASRIEDIYRHHGSSSDLQAIVDSASRTLKVEVILVNANGEIRWDSRRHTSYYTGRWRPLDRRALRAAASAKEELNSANLVRFQSPIHGTVRRNGGAILLVANVADVRPGVSALGNVILTVLGTALVVWLLIGLYFTYSISRPLLRITAATKRMAQGDYEVRVPARGDSEISRLATSFNAMAQQVQQSNRVLKDFVANVSHDLRTPLTMITGFSEALVDGTARGAEVQDSAAIIREEAVKMQRMVEDLLQLTRLESGLLRFETQPVDVRAFVQGVMYRTARAHANDDMAVMENRVPADIPPIDVDRGYMERALGNLLNNALQYTPAPGKITVGAVPIGRGWVEISVSDTGVGILRQDVPRVFERFYRTDKARERTHGHSGLGLAIVREIVEAHGGQITVESEEGKGTTFRFTAPQARTPVTTLSTTPFPPSASEDVSKHARPRDSQPQPVTHEF